MKEITQEVTTFRGATGDYVVCVRKRSDQAEWQDLGNFPNSRVALEYAGACFLAEMKAEARGR